MFCCREPSKEEPEKMEIDFEKTEDVAEKMEDSAERERNKRSKQTEKVVEAVPERKSARQKAKEERESAMADLPTENIDWDKVTPLERVRMKEKYQRREKELMSLVDQLQRGYAVYPVGRDRTFRRYWTFRSIPGLFVEDQEDFIPDDYLTPIEQTQKGPPEFLSNHLPLTNKEVKQSREEKSTSSDKENDSFDQGKSENKVTGSVSGEKPLGVNTANVTETVGSETMAASGETGAKEDATSAIDVETKPSVTCQSVHEQITARGKVTWAYYNTVEQVDKLIESLNVRGHREGHLRQTLLEQRVLLEASVSDCPVKQLSLSADVVQKSREKSVRYQSLRLRNRTTQGAVKNASAKELLELNLRESLLDLEERIYIGTLGSLKVRAKCSITTNFPTGL